MISDPRQYALSYPDTNIIINQAIQMLNNQLSSENLMLTIANMLKNENDALINVALNLSPNQAVAQAIWNELNAAINLPRTDTRANIFAIPIILVAGSKSKAKLKNTLDSDSLNRFMEEKQIFNSGFDTFISGKLIDPQNIASLKPSQLYYWVRNLQKARLWLPVEMSGNVIEVLNDGVFLRFLIGVTIDNQENSGLNRQAFSKNSMELMQLINAQLKNEAVTLFPIPFLPIPLSQAYAVGTGYRTEIAIQVALSNIIRKIREQRLTPIATIATVNEAIKISVTSREPGSLVEESLWHLNYIDDFEKTLSILTNLLCDTGIEWEYAAAVN